MKRYIVLVLLFTMSYQLWAARVDQQKAKRVAMTAVGNRELVLQPSEQFSNLYIFSGANCFAIISTNDCAKPVLAYSTEFSFKTENIPENVHGWLASLNAEIQNAVNEQLEPTEETRWEWELLLQGKMPEPKHRNAVKPLVKTHWDQYIPYNNLCPGGSVTGCVATAMAQIMKFWEWPNKGTGSHSYVHDTYGTLVADFALAYDWDNMVNEVYEDSPEVQQMAVSTLMYHCGVSVDMNYSPSGSAAYTNQVGEALYTYFDYCQNDMRREYASDYDVDSWIALLEMELDTERPILYSGWGEGGGHAFVCDGYDANDYLHINWGWSGIYDGYYAYGALNPGTGGVGSGSGGGYNEQNYVIVGMHPNTSPVAAPEDFSASVSDRTVTLHWSSVSGASHYKVYRDGIVVKTDVTGSSFTDSDVFYGNHTYYVKAVNADGVCSSKSDELLVEVTYSGPVVSDLTANVQNHDVHLSWTAPASESAQLKYGDGEAAPGSYGNIYGTGFYWGQRFTPQQLMFYAGMAITSVELFSWKVTDYSLFIYRETEEEMELLASQSFSNTTSGWYTVNLSEPVPIDYENNLMVVFYNDGSTYQYMAACTENYEGSNNARLYYEDGNWYPVDNNISWLIKTDITDGTYTYSIYRDDQTVATDVASTSYVDANVPDGYYQYSVRTNYYGGLADFSDVTEALVGNVGLISLSPHPSEGGNVVGGGYYGWGNTVTVSASANTGYLFDRWTENGTQVSTSDTYSFVVNGDRQLVAEFKDNDLAVVDLSVTEPTCNGGDDGLVTVVVSGGAAPFVFEFEGEVSPASGNSYTFHDIGAGSFPLKVTDVTGYEVVVDVEMGEPEGLSPGEIKSGSEMIGNGGTCSPIVSVQNATSPQATVTYRWSQNGIVLDNSNTAEYTPSNLLPGTYSFFREVMDSCTDWIPSGGTWMVYVSQNDVDENNISLLEVYPNPTSGKMHVVLSENAIRCQIVDLMGNVLQEISPSSPRFELDLSGLPSGMYLIKTILADGKPTYVKVIKY